MRALLQVEPGNRQAQVSFPPTLTISQSCPYDKELEALVSKKLEKDGMVGMAVAGGAALAVGGRDLLKTRLSKPQIFKFFTSSSFEDWNNFLTWCYRSSRIGVSLCWEAGNEKVRRRRQRGKICKNSRCHWLGNIKKSSRDLKWYKLTGGWLKPFHLMRIGCESLI